MKSFTVYLLSCILWPLFSFCQLTENFNDGDFTQNPVWSGDSALWQVVAGQLNSSSATPGSTFYLSTPSMASGNMEWRIYMNLKFSTSSLNYADVYLISDSAALTANGSGYLVRIGGSTDEISLYRKDAGILTEIIEGADGRSQASPSDNHLHLKITRNPAGDWTLLDDNTGTGLNFFTEGTINDIVYPAGAFFGISVTQSTAGFFNKHYFDDIYAGPQQVDTVPPEISAVNAVSGNQADVIFNEPAEITSAQNNLNYFVSNGIGSPASAMRDTNNPALVHLTFSGSFSSGVTNILTANNIQDFSGNVMVSSTDSFVYTAPVTAVFKDIIINEIFADPSPAVGLPGEEYLEVYNRSSKTFNLSGWQISDGSTNGILASGILFPGSYGIICAMADTGLFSSFGLVTGAQNFPSLNNDGDVITLSDPQLTMIDEVNYSDGWYQDDIKKDGGWSLELKNPQFPSGCSDSVNWIASNALQGGTPGTQNSVYSLLNDTIPPSFISAFATDSAHVMLCFSESMLLASINDTNNYFISQGIGEPIAVNLLSGNYCVVLTLGESLVSGVPYLLSQLNLADCSGNLMQTNTITFVYYQTAPAEPGDVIINEILFNPEPYGFDFIEIFNSSQKIIDLSTISVSGADPVSGIIYGTTSFISEKTILLPGAYAVLTENAQDIISRYFVNDKTVLFETNDLPTFEDEEGIVVLTSGPLQDRIDEFHYSESYHFPLLKEVEGVSLERLSFKRPTQDATNWHSAAQTAGYATPTYKNSESSETGDYGNAFNISPEIFSPDEDGHDDVVKILYHFDTPGYVANVTVFDARGRETRKLVRNQLLGNDGAFSWDGINDSREKSAIGIYVIYFEIFHPDGEVKKYKKTCVLGGKL